jgi:hypothetical protein
MMLLRGRKLSFLAAAAVVLLAGAQARADHWEWQWNGINSGWVRVFDDSDNSAYMWRGEASTPPRRPADFKQPYGRPQSLHDASARQAAQAQLKADQAARIRYNQQLRAQGKTNVKPTLLSNYRQPLSLHDTSAHAATSNQSSSVPRLPVNSRPYPQSGRTPGHR